MLNTSRPYKQTNVVHPGSKTSIVSIVLGISNISKFAINCLVFVIGEQIDVHQMFRCSMFFLYSSPLVLLFEVCIILQCLVLCWTSRRPMETRSPRREFSLRISFWDCLACVCCVFAMTLAMWMRISSTLSVLATIFMEKIMKIILRMVLDTIRRMHLMSFTSNKQSILNLNLNSLWPSLFFSEDKRF